MLAFYHSPGEDIIHYCIFILAYLQSVDAGNIRSMSKKSCNPVFSILYILGTFYPFSLNNL